MINKLNLSTYPYRNRTLPYLLSAVLLAIAVVGLIYSYSQLRDIETLNLVVKGNIDGMQTRINELKEEGAKVQNELTPQQKALMIASHKLVASKSFAWSRLFADLEAVLPGSVSSSRISVQNIFKDGNRIKAELDLSVLSRDYQSVMALIANMNNSGIFQAELRGQDLQKTERITFTEYSLHIIYSPRNYLVGPGDVNPEVVQNGGGQ